METKICPKCKRELPATSDYYAFTLKYEIPKINSTCKECVNKASYIRRRRNGEYTGKIEKIRQLKAKGLKECSLCHEILPLSLFVKGHSTTCKECRSKVYKEKYKYNRIKNRKKKQEGETERECNKCKKIFPLTRDYFHLESHGIFSRTCKICRNTQLIDWRKQSGYTKGVREKYEKLRDDGMKKCPDCGEVKPFKDFSRNSATFTNCAAQCKECAKKRMKEYTKSGRRFELDSYYATLLRDRGIEVTPETLEIQRLQTEINRNSSILYREKEFMSVNAAWKWAKSKGFTNVHHTTVGDRMKRGFNIKEAIELKSNKNGRVKKGHERTEGHFERSTAESN